MSSEFTPLEPLIQAGLKHIYERTQETCEALIRSADQAAQGGDPDEVTWGHLVINLDRRAAKLEPRGYIQALHCENAWLAMRLAELRRGQE